MDVTDLGILPTAALVTREKGFDTGLMITAWLNRPECRAVKLFNGNAMGYSRWFCSLVVIRPERQAILLCQQA